MNTVRGVKGAKPRVSGNGDRSKADEEYLAARNRQISAKAQLAELELRARTKEWIPARQAEADLSLILVALRQRILNIHRAWPRRLMGQDLPAMTETLRSLEESLLNELRDIGCVGKPGFVEEREGEQDVDSSRPKAKTKGKKKQQHRG
jgi:hypothetical protein